MNIVLARLNTIHDRSSFTCGEESLDVYLHNYANQDVKRNISRIFVATPENEPSEIIGYYSISAGSIDSKLLPQEITKKLPRFPLPVSIIGRLAVSTKYQGKGFGSILIADAMQRVYSASQIIAVYAIFVEALNDSLREFYKKLGFIELPSQPKKLFMPIEHFAKHCEKE